MNQDLISNTLTGVRPNSVVIKLLSTQPVSANNADPTKSNCTQSAANAGLAGNDMPRALKDDFTRQGDTVYFSYWNGIDCRSGMVTGSPSAVPFVKAVLTAFLTVE